jgi:16S rRNA (guanine966-N2)-methyltransferase
MKDRVREATFNLVGPSIRGMHAIDLFAGTGAIGLEALSRGAARATFIERHVPTARGIQENIAVLGVESRCEVVTANALLWWRQVSDLPTLPRALFSSPPWELFTSELQVMLDMIQLIIERQPPRSIVVVEGDKQFDFATLPLEDRWDVRAYPPAVVGILRTPETAEQVDATAGRK